MLISTIWQRNHTSHTKVYFNEFVANVLRDDIGIVIGQKRHEGVDALKKVSQQPQKPLSKSSQIWATTSDKKDTSQYPHYVLQATHH